MSNSCVNPKVAEHIAVKAVDKILASEELRKEVDVPEVDKDSNEEKYNGLVATLAAFAEEVFKREGSSFSDNDDENVDTLIKALKDVTTGVDSHIDVAIKEFEENKEALEGRVGMVSPKKGFTFMQIKDALERGGAHVVPIFQKDAKGDRELDDNGKPILIAYGFILKTPRGITKQEATIEKIQRAKDNEPKFLGYEYTVLENKKKVVRVFNPFDKNVSIPDGAVPTGKSRYSYNGKTIVTKAVRELYGLNASDTSNIPIMSTLIGNVADSVAQDFFNKATVLRNGRINKLYIEKDGEIVLQTEDGILQEYINERLRGLVSVQGLKNLINDFIELEKEIKDRFGKNTVIISSQPNLVGSVKGEYTILEGKKVPLFIVGKPDLIAVDEDGIAHVIDVKTRKIRTRQVGIPTIVDEYRSENTLGYKYSNTDKHTIGEGYSLQVGGYIRILSSWGVDTDTQPYVVLADTYYAIDDAEVTPEKDRKIRPRDKNDKRSIIETTEGKTLGQVAEEQGNLAPTDKLTGTKDTTGVLYIEPRLHRKTTGDMGSTVITDELQALMGESEGLKKVMDPFEYEKDIEEMLKVAGEDAISLTGGVAHMDPSNGVKTLANTDIGSRPDLASETELRQIAARFMTQVYNAIEELKRNGYTEYSIDSMVENSDYSRESFKGKSHREIVKMLGGIGKVLDTMFKSQIEDLIWNVFLSEEEFNAAKEAEDPMAGYDSYEEYFESEFDGSEEKRQRQAKVIEIRKHIKEHKNQFYVLGASKLTALEKWVKLIKAKENGVDKSTPQTETFEDSGTEVNEDYGDNDYIDRFIQEHIEGLTSLEAWMIGVRHMSPRSSLAKEIRRLLETIPLLDESGNEVMDDILSDPVYIDSTYAVQTLMNICTQYENIDDMMAALESQSNSAEYNWIKRLISRLNEDNNLKIKFFRHFRKDENIYTVSRSRYNEDTGEIIVETVVINKNPADAVLKSNISRAIEEGTIGSYNQDGSSVHLINDHRVNAKAFLEISKKAEVLANTLMGIITNFTKAYENNELIINGRHINKNSEHTADELRELGIQYAAEKLLEENIPEQITELLHAVGLMIPQNIVAAACMQNVDPKTTMSATALVSSIRGILNEYKRQTGKYNNKVMNTATGNGVFKMYADIIGSIAKSIPSKIEASCYEGGKTYYSYSNPSKLGSIVRNLSNLDDDAFRTYLEDNYGRFDGWFTTEVTKGRSKETVYLNRVLEYLRDKKDRKTLAHHIEVEFFGIPYKELGSLDFQLSLLAHYFNVQKDDPKGTRWFGVPTMSNKPTNEFLRLLSIVDGANGDLNQTKYDFIHDHLKYVFIQECNRIADVLYQYVHKNIFVDTMDITDKKARQAGYSEEEIESLKERIKNAEITRDDLIKLASIESGAKFHFMWYLNDQIAKDTEGGKFGNAMAARINTLLTKNDTALHTQRKEQEKEFTFGSENYGLDDYLQENLLPKCLDDIIESELKHMEEIGLFDTVTKRYEENGETKTKTELKYIHLFGDKLGNNEASMRRALSLFILDDMYANINIIQLTGGDLAQYGNAIKYQKRIAQIHSPGIHVMHQEGIDDGFLRSVHITDASAASELIDLAMSILGEMSEGSDDMAKKAVLASVRKQYDKIKEITDGQSYDSISSMKKKLRLMGEWDDRLEEAYQRVKSGKYNTDDLNLLIQPMKPFVTAGIAKYSGSPTIGLRKVVIQDKSSEYMLLLADALVRSKGKRSKMTAIFDFMEATQVTKDNEGNIIASTSGIDTVHFESVSKVGLSKAIDINVFDKTYDEIYKNACENNEEEVLNEDKTGYLSKDEAYSALLTKYLLKHVKRATEDNGGLMNKNVLDDENGVNSKLKPEEKLYNNQYVDTIPVEDYIIQQEVPEHFDDYEQLYGSQIRILGISDITKGAEFFVTDAHGNVTKYSDATLISRYKQLHAENIEETAKRLLRDLGLDEVDKFSENYGLKKGIDSIMSLPVGSTIRNKVLERLETLLQIELAQDAKYGADMRRSCTLIKDDMGNYVDFAVPLLDPIQSSRVQMLLNSIIRKRVNRQRINGGSLVQATAYDENLHIRFKDEKGNLVKTLEEINKERAKKSQPQMTFDEYKKKLAEEGASIAYYECYAPVPDTTLEKLILKDDGSYMTPEEIEKKHPEVWKRLSQMIGYRIPTEDKYSMIPIKIVGFVPKLAGQVLIAPKEITLLTGSDFDIDKMFIMKHTVFTKSATDIMKGALGPEFKSKEERKEGESSNMTKFVKILVNNYNTSRQRTAKGTNQLQESDKNVYTIVSNGFKMLSGDSSTGLGSGIKKDDHTYDAFMEWYRAYLLVNSLSVDPMVERPGTQRQLRNNELIDIQWAVLTAKDTMSKMLNPGNFIPQKMIGRVIKAVKEGVKINGETATYESAMRYYKEAVEKYGKGADDVFDALFEKSNNHNTTLTSSKIYFQKQNMQGSQMVGTFANHNVSHAFCTFQHIGVNFRNHAVGNNMFAPNSFYLDGHLLGDVDHGENNITVLDRQRGFDGTLISKTIASFLAASVDTAKDPCLSDLNVNPFTGSIAMALARMGYNTEVIGLFLAQPILVELANTYFQNKSNVFSEYYDARMAISDLCKKYDISKDSLNVTDSMHSQKSSLSKESLINGLTDKNMSSETQLNALRAFKVLVDFNKDLQDLTFCTKFNSVVNAVGPTIADTEADYNRVNSFIERCNSGNSYFYVKPSNVFTNPAAVISNDSILNAFYENTLGEKNGVSRKIFRHFFPHYFQGFQEVLKYFREEFTGNNKLNTQDYNKLLNAYIYYLLTYNDPKNGVLQALPTNKKSIEGDHNTFDYLVSGIIDRFKVISQYKRSRPNVILDDDLFGSGLRVRKADQYISVDTLRFASGGLNTDNKEEIGSAWSDLITMNDPNLTETENKNIRRFGIDLFFYMLMKNGFGFNPNTMMHLATLIVKENATFIEGSTSNYIDALRRLRYIDRLTSGSIIQNLHKNRFCSQFVRNNSSNKSLVPTISKGSMLIQPIPYKSAEEAKLHEDELNLFVFPEEEAKLNHYLNQKKNPRPFISLSEGTDEGFRQTLYMLDTDRFKNGIKRDSDGITIAYRKVSKLGIANNFIEYDANSDLQESFFASIHTDAVSSYDLAMINAGYNEDAKNYQEGELEDNSKYNDLVHLATAVNNILENKNVSDDLKDSLREAQTIIKESKLGEGWNNLKKALSKEVLETIERKKEELNKCMS